MQPVSQVLSISTHGHRGIPTTRSWKKGSSSDMNILNPMRTIKLIHGTTNFLGSHKTSARLMNNTGDSNGVDCWFRLDPAMSCLIPPIDTRLVFIAACHFLDSIVGCRIHHVPTGIILVAQRVLQGDVASRVSAFVESDMILGVLLTELPKSRAY